ncbi:hypothetical protein M8J76_001503 [Diaphorina citri]|nr:hypothetical protein M8J76_001503 [Diaphorina citri]
MQSSRDYPSWGTLDVISKPTKSDHSRRSHTMVESSSRSDLYLAWIQGCTRDTAKDHQPQQPCPVNVCSWSSPYPSHAAPSPVTCSYPQRRTTGIDIAAAAAAARTKTTLEPLEDGFDLYSTLSLFYMLFDSQDMKSLHASALLFTAGELSERREL